MIIIDLIIIIFSGHVLIPYNIIIGDHRCKIVNDVNERTE